MVEFNDVTIRFAGTPLFSNASFLVNGKEKVGLVGKNGTGKSTILKLIAGLSAPSEGNITIPKETIIGYLPQQMVCDNNLSVIDETRKAFDHLLNMEKQIAKLNEQLVSRTDYESNEYATIIDQLNDLNDRFQIHGGQNIDGQVERVLNGLGFTTQQFDMSTSQLSGGWRMRIELAKLLLRNPNILLLDEPTNHLDIESIQWLENFLLNYNGIIILVSHDRTFLDTLTTRTIEINAGRIYDYKTFYSKFLTQRAERIEQQIATFKNQQKFISETEDFIERFRYKATKANQVQSRVKQLEKIDRIEIDELDTSKINIRFPEAPRSGTIVTEIKNLSKSYETKHVLDKLDLIIERGEKIAFVGKNGEGKTTLARIINGELDYESGQCKIGHNVNIGYFAQNQDETLTGDKTVFQTLDDIAVGDVRTKLRDILGAFLFSNEDVDKKVKVLSGGERSRLAMAKLMLEPYNYLILDEPTNHLDIPSKEVLKQAIKNFKGTVVIVSHDRYFLDDLTDRILEFKDKNVKEYRGGIQRFIEAKKIQNLDQLNIKTKEKVVKETPETKLDFEQRKEINRQIKRIEKQVSQNEDDISLLETEIEEMDKKLANPDLLSSENVSSDDFFKLYNEKKKLLEEKLSSWEELNLELEEIKKQKDS